LLRIRTHGIRDKPDAAGHPDDSHNYAKPDTPILLAHEGNNSVTSSHLTL
jgi:hypothetical protein